MICGFFTSLFAYIASFLFFFFLNLFLKTKRKREENSANCILVEYAGIIFAMQLKAFLIDWLFSCQGSYFNPIDSKDKFPPLVLAACIWLALYIIDLFNYDRVHSDRAKSLPRSSDFFFTNYLASEVFLHAFADFQRDRWQLGTQTLKQQTNSIKPNLLTTC